MSKNTTNKVKVIREALGLTKQEFAAFLGIPYTSANNWEVRNTVPKAKYISLFSDKIQNFNKDYFLRENELNWFTPPSHMSNGKQNDSRGTSVRLMTVYSRIAAGAPVETWGEGVFEIPIGGDPRLESIKDKIYGFTVWGDSINEVYNDGDIVYTTRIKDGKVKDDDLVVVFLDSDPDTARATVKVFQWQDKGKSFLLIPKSDNPVHKISHHTLKEVRSMFRVYCGLKFVKN